MKFDELVKSFSSSYWFDDTSVTLLSGQDRRILHSELSRWKKAGKVLQLRQGLYTLAEPYRKVPLHAPALARVMYAPSYLSESWALSWYGIIPEQTVTLTSISTRSTRRFENSLGTFVYRTVKLPMFFGFREELIQGLPVLLATPEKAIVDFWYLEPGEWTGERMESMRFDPSAGIDGERLALIVQKTGLARLSRILGVWQRYAADILEGGISV